MDPLDALREQMRDGFESLKEQRLEDRALAGMRHAENSERLKVIEAEVRRTNGRVTRAEARLDALRGDRGEQGERGERGEPGEEPVTLDRLKWYLVCAGGGGSAMLALLRLMGKL
jgi:hypothetical protein